MWFCAAARAASDAADSTDCFRITNSSYEYVKWLNRENEVQIQMEGERHMETCIGLQSYRLVINFRANSLETLHSCKVFRGMLVIFPPVHLNALIVQSLLIAAVFDGLFVTDAPFHRDAPFF